MPFHWTCASKSGVFVFALLLGSAVRAELGDVHGFVAPELRTAYISLGKLVEDRPMQITSAKGNVDLDFLGRLGVTLARESVSASSDPCAAKDLTLGTLGFRWTF